MKRMKIVVLGLYLLASFLPVQSVALASYSNEKESLSNEHPSEHPAEGSHSHHSDHAEVLMQAAAELKSSNPELSAKLEKLAEKFRS